MESTTLEGIISINSVTGELFAVQVPPVTKESTHVAVIKASVIPPRTRRRRNAEEASVLVETVSVCCF